MNDKTFKTAADFENPRFQPNDLRDRNCHCPLPDPNEEGTKCEKCGGPNPEKKKTKKRVKK